MTDTSSRLLTLLSLLQERRDWPGGELADRLEVSGRTIRRDVERLRGLGYPVESLTGPAGGYRLRAGTAMPPLLLDDDEAIAIAVGLRTAARASVKGIEETSVRALVKLEQVLPSHLRRRVRALGTATSAIPPGGPEVDAQSLSVLAAACRDSERVRFGYRGRDGAKSRREVEPHSLVNAGRRWYLVAWDGSREDPAKDGAAYVAQSLSAAPNRYEARVTLHAPIDSIQRWVPSHWGALERIDDQSCEYRTGEDDLDWLAMRIMMFRVDFEVHEPAELREHLRMLAERYRRAADDVR
jgi:predicted DNA-binding transcriptional regulator YafY